MSDLSDALMAAEARAARVPVLEALVQVLGAAVRARHALDKAQSSNGSMHEVVALYEAWSKAQDTAAVELGLQPGPGKAGANA